MTWRRVLAALLISADRRRRFKAAQVLLPSAFQRTGNSNPLGLLDDELPKIRINSETLARARLLATQEGMSVSEWVRLHVETRVWGAETLATLHADRVRRVGGIGVHE